MSTTLEEAYRLLDSDSSILSDFFNKYYVVRTNVRDNIENIKRKILIQRSNSGADSTKILFCGHSGSGKTTELRNLQRDLEKEGFCVVFVSADEKELSSDFRYTDILLLLIEEALELVKRESIELDAGLLNDIDELLTQITGNKKNSLIDRLPNGVSSLIDRFTDEVIGLNSNDSMRNKAHQLKNNIISTLNKILSSIENSKNKKTFFIIEDLEKVTAEDNRKISSFLHMYSTTIQKLRCFIALAIPHSTIFYLENFEMLKNTKLATCFLPLFQVRKRENEEANEDEIKLMSEIVRKRVPENLIPDEVIRQSAINSGGVIKDFLEMLKESCSKAIAAGQNTTNTDFLNLYIISIKNMAQRRIDTKYIEKLSEVRKQKNKNSPLPVDEDLRYLIDKEHILEYADKDGRIWYDIHPTLEWTVKDDQYRTYAKKGI